MFFKSGCCPPSAALSSRADTWHWTGPQRPRGRRKPPFRKLHRRRPSAWDGWEENGDDGPSPDLTQPFPPPAQHPDRCPEENVLRRALTRDPPTGVSRRVHAVRRCRSQIATPKVRARHKRIPRRTHRTVRGSFPVATRPRWLRHPPPRYVPRTSHGRILLWRERACAVYIPSKAAASRHVAQGVAWGGPATLNYLLATPLAIPWLTMWLKYTRLK